MALNHVVQQKALLYAVKHVGIIFSCRILFLCNHECKLWGQNLGKKSAHIHIIVHMEKKGLYSQHH